MLAALKYQAFYAWLTKAKGNVAHIVAVGVSGRTLYGRGGGMHKLDMNFDDESYPIWLGAKCTDEIVAELREIHGSSYHFITDATVNSLHASSLHKKLSSQVEASLWVVDVGEKTKSLKTVECLAEKMIAKGIDRRSVIIAMGGGVIGNIGGLIAALLFRGIKFVHIPTTLIAAGDSVASLKQAVNLSSGKNLIGCFHTPAAVFIDLSFLHTLPRRQVQSGMYEIIKNSLTIATENVEVLKRILREDSDYSDGEYLEIIESGLYAKKKVMIRDKFERKEGLIFEYGHTVGHAIELAAQGRLPHGEAVGIGMMVAAEVSSKLGMLSEEDLNLHHFLVGCNGLNLRLPHGVTIDQIMGFLSKDNKKGYVEGGPETVAMILLEGIGRPAGRADKPLTLVDDLLIRQCIVKLLS